MSSLRLSELLVGLSRIPDIGMGFEPGEAARATVIAVELARELDLPEPSDVYYVTLLQHIGCTAYVRIGVSSRAAAALFAMEHDLLR